MKQSRSNPFTGALGYYFITIASGALTYTWGRRGYLADGNENVVIGMFALFGVIVCLAVFSMRRSTYRRIGELESKTLRHLTGNKGKQRPLEIGRGKGEHYSPQVEDLIRTYNTFRYVAVGMMVVSMLADGILLK